MMVRLYNTI